MTHLGAPQSLLVPFVLVFYLAFCGASPTTPEQIHLSFGNHENSMTVAWVTKDSTATSTVLYGLDPNNLSSQSEGKSYNYYLPFYISPGDLRTELSRAD